MAVDVKLTDNGSHTQTFNCTRIDFKATRKFMAAETHSSGSAGEDSDSQTVVLDTYQVERLWILTCYVTSWSDYTDMETMVNITMTKAANIPIRLKIGPSGSEYFNYEIVPVGLDMELDMARGGASQVITFKLTLRQAQANWHIG